MSAQHAPHTPPLWRRVLSLPRTRLGWWAVGLSAVSVVLFLWLNIFAGAGPSVVGQVGDPHMWVAPWLRPVVTAIAIVLALGVLTVPLTGGVLGSLAIGVRDRGVLVWFSQVPPAMFFVLLVSAFREPTPWSIVPAAIAILVWAGISYAIVSLSGPRSRRDKGVRG
jgi:hypothetical protein